MVKELFHDPIFLAQKSESADKSDLQTAYDLLDTLEAHRENCVGMAANMIGVKKRIIAFDNNGKLEVMFNPEIVRCSQPYQTRESCLSLIGEPKPVNRFKSVKVKYQNIDFEVRFKTFTGFTAQIIQHEIDHCNGILI